MAKVEDKRCSDVGPYTGIAETLRVDERSDMADIASAAFSYDLATIADAISRPNKGSK